MHDFFVTFILPIMFCLNIYNVNIMFLLKHSKEDSTRRQPRKAQQRANLSKSLKNKSSHVHSKTQQNNDYLNTLDKKSININ